MTRKRTSERTGKRRPAAKRKRPWLAFVLLLVLAAACVQIVGIAQAPPSRTAIGPRPGPALTDARSWGYQLQNVALRSIADGVDLLVVDYSRDGSEKRVFSRAEIEQLRTRADGSKRIVLAYLSIGEAESYRYYWRSDWTPGAPSWLGPENTEWKGNYPVRYWDTGWRDIIMPVEGPAPSLLQSFANRLRPTPYLDRIIDAGFDGAYLDRIDAYDHWKSENANAETEMVNLVSAISAYAKKRRPGFLIVPQNGEELLRFAPYRRVIDGIAKEDLVYGIKGDGQPNAASDVKYATGYLDQLKAEGRPVFVVEYLADPAKRADAIKQLAGRGYIVHFAQRDLRHVPE
jgi:cysteinyl-tRNA synthetase, unknown class